MKNVPVYVYVYNYSAFRVIARGKTDSSGIFEIWTGKTDLLVSASLKGGFAWSHMGKNDDNVTLKLTHGTIPDTSFWFYTIPPIRINNKGKKYIPPDTLLLAQRLYLNKLEPVKNDVEISFPHGGDSLFLDILKSSYGNYPSILKYYNSLSAEKKHDFVYVLNSVYENKKDLVSITPGEMSSLLDWYEKNKDDLTNYADSIGLNYIVAPRIYFENFGTYKDTFSSVFKKLKVSNKTDSTVKKIISFVNSYVDTIPDSLRSRFGGLMNPLETYKGRMGTSLEKYILSVGILRSLDIPARLNYLENGIEYYNGGKWIDVVQNTGKTVKYYNVGIVFHNGTGGKILKLRYYYDFTINKIGKNKIVSLDPDISDGKDTSLCKLAPGKYFIIDGWRNLYGTTYVRMYNFNLKSDTLLNITAGIPEKHINTGNIVVRKFHIPKGIFPKDINGMKINWNAMKKGKNLILILNMNVESGISTIDKFNPKQWRGNVFIFANDNIKSVSKMMRKDNIKCRIFKMNRKKMGEIFHVKTYPSVLVIDKGKTVLWTDGFNPELLNRLY